MHRSVFLEPWWLDAATDGAWDAVSTQRDGRLVGWLPYARSRNRGFSTCGVSPLSRVLFPVVDVVALKRESADRARFQIEDELIRQLPSASYYKFILPPNQGNSLAWQANGFNARIQHTFMIDAGASQDERWAQMRNKTRNVIRRAERTLEVRTIDTNTFVHEKRTNLGERTDDNHMRMVRRVADAVVANGQGRAAAAVDRHGRVHAAVLFVWDSQDLYYFLSTRRLDADLGAVDLLVWHGMRDAMARGLNFDLDGVSTRGRLRFLQGFGGRLASRTVVDRASVAYSARLLIRELRHQLAANGPVERFSA